MDYYWIHCLTMKTAEIHFQEHSKGSNEFVGFNGWVHMVRFNLYKSNCGFGIVPNRHFGHAKQTTSKYKSILLAPWEHLHLRGSFIKSIPTVYCLQQENTGKGLHHFQLINYYCCMQLHSQLCTGAWHEAVHSRWCSACLYLCNCVA